MRAGGAATTGAAEFVVLAVVEETGTTAAWVGGVTVAAGAVDAAHMGIERHRDEME